MTFDYIIIGAGSAGCVLANRLSANLAHKVLLIEAGGPDKKMEIHIPAGYGKLHRSEVDWGFETEPQTHVLNRKIYLPRGKVLGGSSSTNAMAYVRGNRADYDEWATLGNRGWSYADMLPYFKKSEHNEFFENEYHAQGGELNVAHAKVFRTPYADAFVEACGQVGIPHNHDYNGAAQHGAALIQFTIKNQQRHSTATAFLKPVRNRPNLQVLTHATTKRILIENDRAVGVEFIVGKSNTQTAKATREVIVSAGAFASPQLLMLSGIGDANELNRYGITTKKNLSGVGKNLQDHLFVNVTASSLSNEGVNHHLKPHKQLMGLFQWLVFKKGALTVSPLEAMAFLKVSDSPDPIDLQLHFAPLCLPQDTSTFDIYDLNTFPHTDGFTVLPTLLKPQSKGFVGLRSSNVADAPIIQPNFLEAEADRELLIRGMKKAIEIINAPAYDPYRKAQFSPMPNLSDDELLYHIKSLVETVYHPVGTCKMGFDEMAVVDNQLRVHGIESLRVVDASVMPRIVSGNTNAPTIAIAEKASDLIVGKE